MFQSIIRSRVRKNHNAQRLFDSHSGVKAINPRGMGTESPTKEPFSLRSSGGLRAPTARTALQVRNVSRRLERLEQSASAAAKPRIHSVRILLVNPIKGCTGVMVIETGKPITRVDSTPEEIEHVRADLEKRRAPAGKSTDISRYSQGP
jgi:hypothetical protein